MRAESLIKIFTKGFVMSKLLITLVVILVLNLSACGERKTPEQLIVSAGQFSQQGKYADAVIAFKNAVRLAPKNAQARLGLGHVYLNRGNYISAEKELERAVELGADFAKVAPLLAQAQTRLDKLSAVEELVKASEDLHDGDYLIILTYAGMCALGDGQITKAQDYFSQAEALNQSANFSQLSGAYLLYSEGKFNESLAKVNTLLSRTRSFVEASLLQGVLKFSTNDFDGASHAFADYLAVYPLDHKIEFFQVNTLIKSNKFEQANELTDKLLKTFKKSPLAFQYKAQISYQAEKYPEAKEFASQSLGYDNSFLISKMIAGLSAYQLDELEQAYDYLIGLETLLPVTHPINVTLLSIKIKLGHTDNIAMSVAKLNEIQNNESDSYLLQVTSAELMKAGDYASAQSLLGKAEKVSPRNAKIKAQRGALFLSQRDLSGIKYIEQALRIDPSLHDTEFALARQYMQGNDIDKAQAIASKWLASKEYQVSGNILSGLISSQLNKVSEAETYFKEALTQAPNNISALYNLASVHTYKEQTVDAISGYKRVIQLNPNHHNAIRRYGILQAKQNKTSAAIAFLSALHDENKRKGNTHKNLVIGLAQNLWIDKQITSAIELLESLKYKKHLSPRYWSLLAEIYQSNKQNDYALATYKQAVIANPNHYILRIGYISLLQKLQKYDEALLLTKQADKDFPHDENLMTTVAYLEFINKNIQAAKNQLKLLKTQGFLNYVATETEANIAMVEKNYNKAIEIYSDIYQEKSNAHNVINLARALQFSKQGSQAEKVLENYLTNNHDDNQVRMLLAELYSNNNVNENKAAKIIAVYKDVIKMQPDNVVALNNLAWKEYQIAKLDDAKKHIEQAIAQAPDAAPLQESYGTILVAKELYQQAIEVLTTADKKNSLEVNAKVALAEAYIAIKQMALAKEVLIGLSAHDSKLNIKIAKLKQLVN